MKFPIFIALVAPFLAQAAPLAPVIHLNEQDARPESLLFNGTNVLSGKGGGFHIYDATSKQDVVFPKGSVKGDESAVSFASESKDLRLKATFTPHGPYLEVTGEIESLNDQERGFLVDYQLPIAAGSEAFFSGDLGTASAIQKGKPIESNVFPVAAFTTPKAGLALAIPPDAPRAFGLIGDEQGFTIRFYLGVSPKTDRFPRKASFTFLIYGADPAWGFRSALSQYYKFFPDYYTPRLKKDGLYMFQMGDRVPDNVDQYGYNLFETQLPSYRNAIARDQKNGITTFPYMIVGQREIKYLPALPSTYEEALAVFEKWTPAANATFALCKENACAEGDIHLKDEVLNSAVETADDHYSIVVRNTTWGANSITFRINPSPYLFEGSGRRTVGGDALATTDRWLKETPEFGGMFIDSLGANWPAILNYRADHFPFVRYPLTVDPDGHVAIDNASSHYEYINALREKLRPSGRLLNGNGVYAYVAKKPLAGGLERQSIDGKKSEFLAKSVPIQFYRPGIKLSRFFLAALLDVASCEFGSKATVEQSRDCRVLLGPKQFSFLNYQWTDAGKVEEFVNKSLCFGIFASTTTNFFTGEQYETSPRGYLRDKPLLDWYVPLVRKLSRAGWEPVRGAEVEGANVSSERFGSGSTVYLTLYNDGTEKSAATVRPDFAALGFKPDSLKVAEIGRHTPVQVAENGVLSLELEPKKTYVLEFSSGNQTLTLGQRSETDSTGKRQGLVE